MTSLCNVCSLLTSIFRDERCITKYNRKKGDDDVIPFDI